MQALASRGTLLLSSVSQGEAEAAGLAANATPVPCLDLLTSGDVGRGHQPGHHSHEGVGEHFCEDDGQQGTAKSEYVVLVAPRKPPSTMKTRRGQGIHAQTTPQNIPSTESNHVSSRLSCVDNSEGDCRPEVEELQRRRWSGISVSLLEVGVVGDEQSAFVPRQGARGEPGLSNPDVVVLLHQPRGEADGDGGSGNGGAPVSRPWGQADEEGAGHNADVVVMLCGPLSCTCEELRHRSVAIFLCCLIRCAPRCDTSPVEI